MGQVSGGGEVVGAVQIRTEVVREEVAPAGAPSNTYHLEVLRVVNAGTNAETTVYRSRGVGPTIGGRADPAETLRGNLVGTYENT